VNWREELKTRKENLGKRDLVEDGEAEREGVVGIKELWILRTKEKKRLNGS